MIGRATPGNVRSEVMATTDINQLDISTLDADGVEALIAAGETAVERKGDLPKDGLGSSVAAYANSGGGWMLLGISDAGEAVGWKQRGRAEGPRLAPKSSSSGRRSAPVVQLPTCRVRRQARRRAAHLPRLAAVCASRH